MYQNIYYQLSFTPELAFVYKIISNGAEIPVEAPSFEINGRVISEFSGMKEITEKKVSENILEISAVGEYKNGVKLMIRIRVCGKSPIIRFCYKLTSSETFRMTKEGGKDNIVYLKYPEHIDCVQKEIRLSEYNYMTHCYCLNEVTAFDNEDNLMGPILTEQYEENCMLTAYEHGSQYPDKFIAFYRNNSKIEIRSEKGNYYTGQLLDEKHSYDTVWLQLGAIKGSEEELAKAYRTFQMSYCSLNKESRKPYIFYNTWAFQERNKFYHHQTYLTSMMYDRIDQEIEAAHKMGIDVFVLDTGWYMKTGDWDVNLERFPDGLQKIRRKLEAYGMKLGLWFNPIAAAKSSKIYLEHQNDRACMRDSEPSAFPIWETEESYMMCLVSDYWTTFAERLIKLVDDLGVSYFKWDAVDLYGCQCGGHDHGLKENSALECDQCYAFLLGQYMSKIVDKVCMAHPEVIVDVDITEGSRYFGLGFLSSGKFFAINNGPYYANYDIDVPEDVWINIFVNPGPARTWICRKSLIYDKWIPSVLMMAHYLPDDPRNSQMLNLGSLVLGQNGIWGDLLTVSKEGIDLFRRVLQEYKKVRDDITSASAIVFGQPGETFEVHEKINPENGKGVIVLFSNQPGTYQYRVKASLLADAVSYGNVTIKKRGNDILIEAVYTEPNAAIIFYE